ncbi:hypothetical protein PoB_007673000 [Plakobranchus ocellatus]|uniref:Uncharacterized protein n=1 Tax=Plakobranchus ocellatus TaxID=259542 RepID=A0AAV4E1R6_9GAST|nr:hypothetical protein PoB_007673000 [Plakobranchus ocellatus]
MSIHDVSRALHTAAGAPGPPLKRQNTLASRADRYAVVFLAWQGYRLWSPFLPLLRALRRSRRGRLIINSLLSSSFSMGFQPSSQCFVTA